MLHPSYSDLMAVANSEVEDGEQPGSTEQIFYRYGYIKESQTDYCR